MRESNLYERILIKLRSQYAQAPVGLTVDAIERALHGDTGFLRFLTPKHVISWDNPTFLVQDGTCAPPEGSRWRSTFDEHGANINRAISTVGRFEAPEFRRPSFGTGWLVSDGVVATAGHLADHFQERQAQGGLTLRIDFRGEHGSMENLECPVVEVLESSAEHDLGFVRIDAGGVDLPAPVELADHVGEDESVCLIGYPSDNTSIYPQDEVEEMFARIFDVKRVAPGAIREVSVDRLAHDCTSLGGNSGAMVLDIEGGKAIGLHFGGKLGYANWAVPARVIRERLARLKL